MTMQIMALSQRVARHMYLLLATTINKDEFAIT